MRYPIVNDALNLRQTVQKAKSPQLRAVFAKKLNATLKVMDKSAILQYNEAINSQQVQA